MEDVEKHELFLRGYVTDLSLFNVYKKYVNNLITECSLTFRDGEFINVNSYNVGFVAHECIFEKIYNLFEDLFNEKILNSIHHDIIYNFVKEYISTKYHLIIGIDNDQYKIWMQNCENQIICLVLTDTEHFFKSYKSIDYINYNSIKKVKEFGLDLTRLPIRKSFQVSSLSKSINSFNYIDKYYYLIHEPFYHLFDHKIFCISSYENDITFYLKPGLQFVINDNPYTIKLEE